MPPMIAHSSFTGRVGVARGDITPPVGIFCRNWGAARHDAAEGIHRPLSLTALAIQAAESGDPLVLVDVDLGWWGTLAFERGFRRRVLQTLGLPEERLLFCTTHTHSAPPLCPPEPHWRGGELLPGYLEAFNNLLSFTFYPIAEFLEVWDVVDVLAAN
ncbi:MAG: hypothetical protein EBZ59_05270 [Planctomycetia bacterium]|nr:hypothetical protein [Planctomycetia bacterium]